MSTDNRRREVAKRLRELEIGFMGTCIPTGDFTANILKAIGYGNSDAMTPYGLLADIIDPTCKACRDMLFYPDTGLTPEHEETIYRCSACGQVLTYDDDFNPETDNPAYCESCGSRVTGIGEPLDE